MGLDLSKQCHYTQLYFKTNRYFMESSDNYSTHHDLRTIQFDNPNCMSDRLKGFEAYPEVARMLTLIRQK